MPTPGEYSVFLGNCRSDETRFTKIHDSKGEGRGVCFSFSRTIRVTFTNPSHPTTANRIFDFSVTGTSCGRCPNLSDRVGGIDCIVQT